MAKGRVAEAWAPWVEALWGALHDDAPLPVEALRRLLRALVVEPTAAVWHPTGFLVLTLGHGAAGSLRLHLWPEGPRQRGTPCWPVHDHVWDLRSQVLCGRVESRGYTVVDDEQGDAVLYAVAYDEDRRSTMRRSDRRVSVCGKPPLRIGAGARYEVAAGEFHASTVAVGDFAATLAATLATGRRWPWVVGDLSAPRVVPVERPLAETGSVRELLRRVVALVDDPMIEHERSPWSA